MQPIQTEFVEAGDLRFEVDVCGDPSSERLALFLHGFPECAFSWRHQLPLLASLGYKAWAPNQRGYGRTTRPAGISNYCLDALVDDVAHLIDASGCPSVTLIGHDWGGIVTWAAALPAVRPLDRLVLLNTPHPKRMADALRSWRQVLRSSYAFLFQVPRLPEALLRARGAWAIGHAFRGMAIDKSRFPDDVLGVYRAQALDPGALTAMLNWYRAAVRHRNGRLAAILDDPPHLDIPTLMIWGEADVALGKEMTYDTEELISDLTIRYLPQVSHWVQQEAPESVNAMLEAWLTGRPVPEHVP